MSRLDYITVGIVGLCVLAIIFLVYKMGDLFSANKAKDTVEMPADTVETDDTYDYDIEDSVDSTGAGNKPAGGTATDDASKSPAAADDSATEQDASTSAAEDDEKPASSGSTSGNKKPGGSSVSDEEATSSSVDSGGKFLVIAGSFSQKSLAQKEAKRLQKKGYESTKVESFDRGKFAVVLVDRFDNMADAERLVKNLKADGVNSFVKLKQ